MLSPFFPTPHLPLRLSAFTLALELARLRLRACASTLALARLRACALALVFLTQQSASALEFLRAIQQSACLRVKRLCACVPKACASACCAFTVLRACARGSASARLRNGLRALHVSLASVLQCGSGTARARVPARLRS